MAKFLVSKACNLLAVTSRGASAMHIAARDGKKEIIEWLYEMGLSLEDETNEGKTPVQYAEEYGHNDVAETLRELINPVGAAAVAAPSAEQKQASALALEAANAFSAGARAGPSAAATPAAPSGQPPAGPAFGMGLHRPSTGPMGSMDMGMGMGNAMAMPGAYYQTPVFFSPPGHVQAFLRFKEPGYEMHHPWPTRYCVLHDNVLFVFPDMFTNVPMTSVPLEGVSVDHAGMVTGVMFTFVIGKMRPMMEGPGMYFEEYFQAQSQMEAEQWVQLLKTSQKGFVKERLAVVEQQLGQASAGGEGQVEAVQKTCMELEDKIMDVQKARKAKQDLLRKLRAEYDLLVGKSQKAASLSSLQKRTVSTRAKVQEQEKLLKGAESKAREDRKSYQEAKARLDAIDKDQASAGAGGPGNDPPVQVHVCKGSAFTVIGQAAVKRSDTVEKLRQLLGSQFNEFNPTVQIGSTRIPPGASSFDEVGRYMNPGPDPGPIIINPVM